MRRAGGRPPDPDHARGARHGNLVWTARGSYRGWMARSSRAFGLMVMAACGPGTSDPSGSSSASGTTSTSGSSSTAHAPTSDASATSSATTIMPETTSTATSGVGTTVDTSMTTMGFEPCGMGSTTDLGDWAGNVPECVDPQIEWMEEHLDCVLDCSTMTQLHGEGPAAALGSVTRITFGITYGACGKGLALERLYLGNNPTSARPSSGAGSNARSIRGSAITSSRAGWPTTRPSRRR